MEPKAVRFITPWLAAFATLLAGAATAAAEEFRTPSISAMRVEWRAALDQLRAEINSEPRLASYFSFAGPAGLPAGNPRATPALVQLNGVTSPIFPRHQAQPNSGAAAVRYRGLPRARGRAAHRRQPLACRAIRPTSVPSICSMPGPPAMTRCSRLIRAPATACRSGLLQSRSRCRSQAPSWSTI